jgi:hypothetical protein
VLVRVHSWLTNQKRFSLKKMIHFIKKHTPNLNSILLILMLAIPFLLYYFARAGSDIGVVIFLVIMGAVMLVAMKK